MDLIPQETKKRLVNFKVDREEVQRVDQLAKTLSNSQGRKISRSDIFRHALKLYLKHYEIEFEKAD